MHVKRLFHVFIKVQQTMSLCARSLSKLWVLILLLLWAKNAMAVVTVTNALYGNFDLTIKCSNIDPKAHTLRVGESRELNYSGSGQSGPKPLFCFFQWGGGPSRPFDLCVPARSGGCLQCSWIIKQGGPCRYEGARQVCSNW